MKTIMMNVCLLVLLVVMAVHQSEANTRRCFCSAKINGHTIAELNEAVVSSCTSSSWWRRCKCSGMSNCPSKCEQHVRAYADGKCPEKYVGQYLKAYYKSSNCRSGYCGIGYICRPPGYIYCNKTLTKLVPKTCYKTVSYVKPKQVCKR